MSTKNPLTPAGIEPATFRFVAQHLNHCANAVPQLMLCRGKIAVFVVSIQTTTGHPVEKMKNFSVLKFVARKVTSGLHKSLQSMNYMEVLR